jgi:hypothetical protein
MVVRHGTKIKALLPYPLLNEEERIIEREAFQE